MALRIFISNHAEKLAETLARGLLDTAGKYRAADPLRKTRIIVQSRGMEIWLKQVLVAGGVPVINFEFPFVVKGIKDILGANFGAREVDNVFRRYSEAAMTWSIDAVLREDGGRFFNVLTGDEGSSADIKRFDFARCAAAEFDRLQTYRPGVLEEWEAGKNTNCPPALLQLPELWRRLRQANSDCPDTPALLIKKFIQLQQPAVMEPVSVFGIGSMPEEYFKVLARSAEVNTVNFFYTNICKEYWSFHPLARERLTEEAAAMQAAPEDTNPLIKACGHRNREFFQTIEKFMDSGNVQWQEEWVEEEQSSLLKDIQNEVLNMSSPETPIPFDPAGDLSITVHGAHSKMRQVEIVHDLILDAVNKGDIQLNDILVMAPDIGSFARDIQAVFSGGPLRGCFAVSDRNTDESNTLAGCMKAVIETARSRFELHALIRLLQRKLLQQNFKLSEQNVSDIEKIFYTAGVRWGLDGEMRSETCGVHFGEYSWQEGIDRVLAGLALEDDDLFAPVPGFDDTEGQDVLMSFLQFMERLKTFRMELKGEKTPQEWSSVMIGAINAFTGLCADSTERSTLQKAVSASAADAAAGNCSQNRYPFEVFYRCLQKALSSPPPRSAFLSGKITFSSIQPMRNIPRRMIVLMGMDDGQFPRRDEVRNIDVFGRRLPGERSRIFEDRAIFLETILAAREKLAFVYGVRPASGRGEDLPPAMPLKEVLEYIKNTRINGDKITVKHPAYGFSPVNFTGGDPRIFSYSQKYLEMARGTRKSLPEFCGGFMIEDLEERPAENISIAGICAFLRSPQEFFLKNCLDMNVYESRDVFSECEDFSENRFCLSRYRDELGKAVNTGADIEVLWERYSRMAIFPVGAGGRMIFDKMVNECRIPCSELLARWASQEKFAAEVTLPSGDRISGIIEAAPDQRGIVKCCFGSVKKKHFISLYAETLILAAQDKCSDMLFEIVDVKAKKTYKLLPVGKDEAVEILSNITALMKEAKHKCPSLLGISSAARQMDGDKFNNIHYEGKPFGFAEYDRESFSVRKCFPEDWRPLLCGKPDMRFAAESDAVYKKLIVSEADL